MLKSTNQTGIIRFNEEHKIPNMKVSYLTAFLLSSCWMTSVSGQLDTSGMIHTELPTFVKEEGSTTLARVSMRSLEYKRAPGSFQDPTRILLRYPGFSTTNDGANGFSYRGLPPQSMQWHMYGTRVINPNHLSNAGTTDDQPAYNSGGTISITGSALGAFEYHAPPAEIAYSDAPSGIAHIQMAPKIRSYVDLGLLGFEGGYNHKLSEDRSAYVTVRNSFTGVLGLLGVDFGGERINFTDASTYVEAYKSSKSKLTFFGTVGQSSNYKSPVPLGDSLTSVKDVLNIDYNSRHLILGGQYSRSTNHSIFNIAVTTSSRKDVRVATIGEDYFGMYKRDFDRADTVSEHIPISIHLSHTQYNHHHRLTYGLKANRYEYNARIEVAHNNIYPYVCYKYDRRKFIGQLGAALPFRSKLALDLQGSAIYSIDRVWSIEARTSYTHPAMLGMIPIDSVFNTFNAQMAVKYEAYNWKVSATAFYHYWNDVKNIYYFGFVPYGEYGFNGDLVPKNGNALTFYDDARSRGLEIQASKTIGAHWNVEANTTLFKAEYRNSAIWYQSRYGYGHLGNLGLYYRSNGQKAQWIVGAAYHTRGGEVLTNFFINEKPEILDPYHRVDARLSYFYPSKRQKFIHRWSLDIQNVLNTLNDGYRAYDPLRDDILIYNQLGLIPVLSYRIEWNN
jgi:hypothetical protein